MGGKLGGFGGLHAIGGIWGWVMGAPEMGGSLVTMYLITSRKEALVLSFKNMPGHLN